MATETNETPEQKPAQVPVIPVRPEQPDYDKRSDDPPRKISIYR